ncbi:DUF488 domain-containing protein [Dictyobacter formicarum]|uniref:DUF488 domain-containing protein n=1 Tax=Dictyobacter formicarum TaxID=2778368 RepID=A0ABQ3VR28_9CHLR|nr:DUF488 domain-containing protein [Dictyobacter formicarum]GHO88043.1 hypothetical protein KSZ_60490 [Dictyobacter formicarum]
MPPGTIYPLGYADSNTEPTLEAIMQRPDVLLVDIRLVPQSRWRPQWNKSTLQGRWGERYLHKKQLGNIHFRDSNKPIRLLDPDQAIQDLAQLLQSGTDIVLLCACKNYDMCHRRVIVERLKALLPEVEVHL